MNLAVPDAELRALAGGEVIVAFTSPGAAAPGDHVALTPTATEDPMGLLPAYRRWAGSPPPGEWSAEVVAVYGLARFDEGRLAARHIRSQVPPGGDILVLRVFGSRGPVLSDTAFAARLRSLEAALA